LDQVMLRPEYQDYSTLNVRRLHLSWLVSRLKLNIGPLTYWLENPHALKAFFWLLVPVLLATSLGMNWLVRLILRRAGWIHSSDVPALQDAAVAAASLSEPAARMEPWATRTGTAD